MFHTIKPWLIIEVSLERINCLSNRIIIGTKSGAKAEGARAEGANNTGLNLPSFTFGMNISASDCLEYKT